MTLLSVRHGPAVIFQGSYEASHVIILFLALSSFPWHHLLFRIQIQHPDEPNGYLGIFAQFSQLHCRLLSTSPFFKLCSIIWCRSLINPPFCSSPLPLFNHSSQAFAQFVLCDRLAPSLYLSFAFLVAHIFMQPHSFSSLNHLHFQLTVTDQQHRVSWSVKQRYRKTKLL